MNQLTIDAMHLFDGIRRQKRHKLRRLGHDRDAAVVRAGKHAKQKN
jgi:hypothetical protein